MNGLIDFGPLIEKNLQVAHKIPRALTFSDCADDDADAIRNIQLTKNFAQPLTFLRFLDFSRDTAAIAERHQHQIAAGKTEIGCDARPLGADWAFGNLHDHIRTHRINGRDVFNGDPLAGALIRAPVDFFDPAVERRGNRIPKMEERVLFEADVNKHRLQTHLDVFDFALVNAAYDVPRTLTLNTVFLEAATLEQSHTGLESLHAQYEFVAGLA